MKVFVFNSVSTLTDRYHDGGGLVVVAADKERAEELIAQDEHIQITDTEWSRAFVYELAEDVEEEVFIFPDAGCC